MSSGENYPYKYAFEGKSDLHVLNLISQFTILMNMEYPMPNSRSLLLLINMFEGNAYLHVWNLPFPKLVHIINESAIVRYLFIYVFKHQRNDVSSTDYVK